MVNTTLTKGHHAETQRTARNLLIFSHDSSTPTNYTLLFLTGEDDYTGSIPGDTRPEVWPSYNRLKIFNKVESTNIPPLIQ